MRPKSPEAHQSDRSRTLFAPKIYYFHPLLAGPRAGWGAHLARCRELGFDHVLMAPPFAPGASGNMFVTADHELANPAIEPGLAVDRLLEEFAAGCREHGLRLLLDIVLSRAAADTAWTKAKPNWFRPPDLRVDPRAPRDGNAVDARFDDPGVAEELAAWWIERLLRLADAGVAGFRCEDPQFVPPSVWRRLIGAVKSRHPGCRFLAWTPGMDWQAIAGLNGVGFDAAFSSVAWWDGRASWLVEEFDLLRRLGSVIACPEALFGPRLASAVKVSGNPPMQLRHLLRRAAATGTGIMIPMGLEFGATVPLDRHGGNPDHIAAGEPCTRQMADAIREANALTAQLGELGIGGEMRMLTAPARSVTALVRSESADVRYSRSPVVVLINTDLREQQPLPISLDPLPAAAGAAMTVRQTISGEASCAAALGRGEIRVLGAEVNAAIKLPRPDKLAAALAKQPRVAIENVTPSVDGDRFAVKRIIGDSIVVEADVFSDGHEVLAAQLLWRSADANDWHRVRMAAQGNDHWRAAFLPDRIGRHEFYLEAWWDRYATFCRDLETKAKAGVDVSLELIEGKELLRRARDQADNGDTKVLSSALNWLADATPEASVEVFLMPDVREVMAEVEERLFLSRGDRVIVEVERPQAAFAAWYELFPRSATDTPDRHGTFADVAARLPAIKAMGFDVLYLTPIHPIGVTNRKGKNNSLDSGPDDLGSPYAIGGAEGGHDAIHPALGTVEDFRRLRDDAAAHGLEIALDFAIQCSPDHPWLKQHPQWFNWRPDGSVRYAENPPKKYQDIVNVDFYAADAFPELWTALLDIVFYWIREGVRIFRVDNPHTKPLPFWEWLIVQVRGRYPDVIFLSEAFTRPRMMYRLAKAGFSQSYSYFTWRNSKQELTDYFVELTTTPVKEYFRPHLFVNTPDINPYFLQTSGRPGFLIRAALAATLSGLWGMYSGFELCEAAALPGREEYLDSEKYEIRVRDYAAPGNISGEIARLNRIRRSNIALQSHLGVRFYPAHDDQVLLYGKMPADGATMILVAVSLDPFRAHDVTIEVPLWEWNLPDAAATEVRDLMRDTSLVWHGKLQRVRLDPADLPFAIWQVSPRPGG